MTGHVGAGTEVDITAAKPDQLGDPQPGLYRHQEQRTITPPCRGLDVRRVELNDLPGRVSQVLEKGSVSFTAWTYSTSRSD